MVTSVHEQFASATQAAPDLPFLCYPGSPDRGYLPSGATFSYGQAFDLVEKLAARYLEAGFGPGHRIATLLGNRPEHFWHLLALNRIGASMVPLNPSYLDHELHYAIEFADTAMVVTTSDRLPDLARTCGAMSPAVPVHDIACSDAALPMPGRRPAAVPSAPADREAMIIYTSGTTGRPKGCILSNTSCLAAGESYGTAGGLIDFDVGKDRLYIPLPAFHMNVSVYTLNTMTRLHNCIVLQDRFRASTWWLDIVETGATCLHYMGIIPPLLVKAAPSEIEARHKVKFGQGAGVEPAVREAFETRFGFPLIEAWGMTETSRAIQNCHLPRDPGGRAFGHPRPPLEVRIVNDDGAPVPPDTPGELLVRSEGPDPRHGFFSGYLKQPEETEKVWQGGWFHTGDVVLRRPDGMLVFVDRKKNIIRRSGENIAAAEIEETLIENPSIKGVAVLAVPDELHDEEVMACVVLMADQKACEKAAVAIFERASGRLAPYKRPGWISFIDQIPVTGTQKIRKDAIFPGGTDPRHAASSFDLRALKRKAI